MFDPTTRGPHTYHTTNPVPFVFVSDDNVKLRHDGALKDIAPTVLDILNLDKPAHMSGQSLRIKSPVD